jgi:hypothetical protein
MGSRWARLDEHNGNRALDITTKIHEGDTCEKNKVKSAKTLCLG